MTLTVGSLFSGIGGMDLGLERSGMEVRWHAEIDEFGSRILRQHWPHVPNLGDVTRTDWSTVEHVDVIAGGYPCQPFSVAGEKRGTDDERHLWPYMLRAAATIRPRWIIGENVGGHVRLGLDIVLADLRAIGYDARWGLISACAVGAPHMRRRVFWVAYPESFPVGAGLRTGEPSGEWWGRPGHGGGPERIEPCECCGEDWCWWHRDHRDGCGCSDPWDESDDPDFGWWTTEPGMGRVAYGLPARVDRLRGLGNAVVPAVAETIGRIVVDADRRLAAA